MYKAVAVDLDGTILTSENKVSKRTEEIFSKIKKKGIKIIIATGRTLTSTKPIKDQLKLGMPLITNNGSRVYDENEKLLKEYSISAELLNKILELNRTSTLHLNIYKDEKWYVEKENFHENIVNYQRHNNFYYIMSNFEDFKGKAVTKLVYIGEHEELVELDNKLKKISSSLKTMFSTEYALEVINSETSKAYALMEILKNENIDIKDTLAFGDGFNDYEMLSNVGKACIMGNAHYKLKESLPHIEVIGTNDEDSVAKYLENIYR